MKIVRYYCNHCGREFESEEKETLECPGCFWSTSVVLADERKETEAPVSNEGSSSQKKINWGAFIPVFKIAGMIGVGIILVCLLVWAAKPFVGALGRRSKSIQLSFTEKAAQPEKAKPKSVAPKKNSKTPVLSPFEKLSEEEKNILSRSMKLSADRPVSPEEQEILQRQAPFQTGIVEKIPSQSWSLEKFKAMIAEQERFYKVPLPRSYKGKLEDLFKAKYLPASEAFKTGDMVKARDMWVESLAFPIYSDNPARHRGVVLTMVRPFINDTLSKIGAINSTLVEGKIRLREQQLSEAYTKLLGLLKERSWSEAAAVILEIDKNFEALEKPEQVAGAAPTYPAAIAQIDADIQATLAAILTPPAPAIADLEPVRIDIRAKRKVVESFMAPNFEAAQTQYLEALDFIQKQNWQEAEKRLRGIESPIALARDAADKIKILKKLQESSLDSPGESG